MVTAASVFLIVLPGAFFGGNAGDQTFSRNLNICWQCGKLRIAQNHEELLGCLYGEIVTLSNGGKKHDHTLNKIRDVEGSDVM